LLPAVVDWFSDVDADATSDRKIVTELVYVLQRKKASRVKKEERRPYW
jgi:hypothetical protein